MLIRVLRVGFSDVSGISTRLIVGVISAMIEKELGQRNFDFEPRHGGERNCCLGLSHAGAPLPTPRLWRCLGNGLCSGSGLYIYRQRAPPPPRRWSLRHGGGCRGMRLPRHRNGQWTAGSGATVGDNPGQHPFSSMSRLRLYFRLMWKWKKQRRCRT